MLMRSTRPGKTIALLRTQ